MRERRDAFGISGLLLFEKKIFCIFFYLIWDGGLPQSGSWRKTPNIFFYLIRFWDWSLISIRQVKTTKKLSFFLIFFSRVLF